MTQEDIHREGNRLYVRIPAQNIQDMDILLWNGSPTEPAAIPLVRDVVTNARTCVTVDLLYPQSTYVAKHHAGRGEVLRIDFEKRIITVLMCFKSDDQLSILLK